MNSVLLIALIIIVSVGIVFMMFVIIGIGSMCQRANDDISELKKELEEIEEGLAVSGEFDQAVADCIGGIGDALDIINERTNWLDGVNAQISNIFGQNKNGKES